MEDRLLGFKNQVVESFSNSFDTMVKNGDLPEKFKDLLVIAMQEHFYMTEGEIDLSERMLSGPIFGEAQVKGFLISEVVVNIRDRIIQIIQTYVIPQM